MSANPLTLPDTVDAAGGLRPARRRPAPGGARRRRRGPAGRPADPDRRAALDALRRPPSTRQGRLRVVAAALGVNGDVKAKAADLLETGVDCLVVDTAHGHQERMVEALQAVRALGAAGAGGGRQRGLRRRGPRPRRRRRRHRQGRRRPGRDVHHPDDDRRRPPAVLRRARVLGRRPASSARTCGPTAACATRATSRWRWPPAPPSVMIGSWFAGTHESPGDLHVDAEGRAFKESFGMASARAVAHRTADGHVVRPGPQGRSTRRASPPRGCTSSRTVPASRT